MAYQRQRKGWRSRRWWSALTLAAILCLEPAGFALARAGEAVAFSIAPTMDRELDEALITSANLPTLLAGEAVGGPSSATWPSVITTEAGRLADILRTFGYLDGRIETDTTQAPMSISFRPVPGPLYRIGLFQVSGISDRGTAAEARGVIDAAVGAPARADVLSGVAEKILRQVRNQGYARAQIALDLQTDTATSTALASLSVTPGPKVRLGPISFYGAVATDPRLLSGLHPFPVGSDYKPGALEALRIAVENLPLVRRARVELEDQTDANGLVPVRVTIVERADPSRLASLKLAGGVALIVALAALSLRQWVQTASRRWPSLQVIQSLDLAVLVVLIAGLALVLARARSFMQ